MFDKVGDLPLHPLAVHAPVVLVPLLAVLAVAYAVAIPWRRYIWWALLLLALAAPATSFVAVQAGKELEKIIGATAKTNRHQGFGQMVLYLTLILAVVTVALLLVDRGMLRARRAVVATNDPAAGVVTPSSSPMMFSALSIVLSVAMVGVAIAAMVYVILAGEAGSQLVWGTTLDS